MLDVAATKLRRGRHDEVLAVGCRHFGLANGFGGDLSRSLALFLSAQEEVPAGLQAFSAPGVAAAFL